MLDTNDNNNSFNYSSENENDMNKNTEVLNSIFKSILKESSQENDSKINSSDLLSIYIRKNRNKINQTLKEISQFFDKESINQELFIQCIEGVYNSLIERSQIINFIKLILPILIKYFNKITINSQNISIITKFNLFIGKFINKGGIYIRELIEKNIDIILEKFNKKENKIKGENNKLVSLQILSQILKNSPMLAFNKIVGKNGFERFLNVINCFKDENKDIRVANGILIYHFLQMFSGRDKETKFFYFKLTYEHIYNQFIDDINKNKDVPKDNLILSGFLITIENINLSEPIFFRDISNFAPLIRNLFKCFDSNNNLIKIEFIKFLPKIYNLNKTEFRDSYENQFLGKINSLLNKDTHPDVRNALFITIGKLSYILDEESYKFFFNQFFSLVKSLISDKKFLDDDLIKCLSDLLNNKKSVYISQIESINLVKLFPKLFKTFFSSAKIDFLISIMKFYENNSDKNMTTCVISLNIISHIICGQFFNLDNFNKNVEIKKNFVGQGLSRMLFDIREDLLNSYKDDSNKKKAFFDNLKLKINNAQIIINALNLFSLIPNNLFFKDMFIFFNDKLLPLLEFVPNKIYKKIIDLILCDFVQIYKDDMNLSDYIFNNIIESIFTTSINEQNIKLQTYSFKVIAKKDILMEYFYKNNNLSLIKILGYYSSVNDIIVQERIIQTIGEIALKDSNKNFYYTFVKKAVYSICFKFYYLDDLIQKENISFLLYYLTSYLINLFYPSLPVVILELTNYLILTSDLRSITIINIFKSLIEIFKSDLMKEINDNIIFKENCDVIFILLFDILKMESIDESQYDIILELIYLIIKNENIDIFNLKDLKKRIKNSSFLTLKQSRQENILNKNYFNDDKIVNKMKYILDKINITTITEILYRNILNVENENCALNALKIFGLCGAIDPNKIENVLDESNTIKYLLEIENSNRAIDEKAIQIITFNNKLKQYEEIDTSLADPIHMKVILLSMEILKMNKQPELSIKIISYLNPLIKSMNENDAILIDIIVPTIIQIFPKFQAEQQKILLNCIKIIIKHFEDKAIKYLDDIIPFIINYIEKDFLDIINEIISIFEEKYKKDLENYYSIIFQKYLSIFNSDYENYFIYENEIKLLIKNNDIDSYLKILYEELRTKLFKQTNLEYINKIFNIIGQICKNKNCEILYSSIINNILNKIQLLSNQIICDFEFKYDQKKIKEYFLKGSPNSDKIILIVKNILNIFKDINDNSREQFLYFLPLIYNIFGNLGIINHPLFKKNFKNLLNNKYDYTFMTNKELIEKIFYSDNCEGNCIYGFHSITKDKKQGEQVIKKFIKKESTKEEKIIDNEEQIVKVFDNTYCTLEEDWDEWLKSCIKILLEKSNSPYLYNSIVITDYYLSIASELAFYGFYSLYSNTNEKTKKKLSKYIGSSLKSPKSTDTVILSILDLIEDMSRGRIDMDLVDYKFYGKICLKIRAYAKSLYYFEKCFLNGADAMILEKLIYLYYELGIPDWAYGLIKLANKRENNGIQNYENKFNWYINIGDYRKALIMIDDELKKEKKEEKIKFLKKKKKLCMMGLFDWEAIFLNKENDENINILESQENSISFENNHKDKYDEIKDVIEEEVFLSMACSNLNKWDHLSTHIYKINKKIKENFDIDELEGLTRDEYDTSEVYLGRNSRDKNSSFHQNDKFTISEYVPYNKLILKNINLFNKVDRSKIFDLNLISSIVNIMEGKFNIAKKYKQDAKELILYKLKPLLRESHTRGYGLLINNQQLSYLEDIIEYKENHDGDLNYLKDKKLLWDKSFSQISFEPLFCRRLLFLFNFMFPEEELFETKTIYGNILRKKRFFEQSKTIFEKLKRSIDNFIIKEKDKKKLISLNEQKIKIELSYNKCLFQSGCIDKAIKKSKNLVNLLKDTNISNIYQNINNKLKGKIYGEYALYIKNKYPFLKESNLPNNSNANSNLNSKHFSYHKSIKYLSPVTLHRNSLINDIPNPKIMKSKIVQKKSYHKNKDLASYLIDNKNLNNNFDEYFTSYKFKADIKHVNNINQYLYLATNYYDKSYKYWHFYSNLNYEVYRFLHTKRMMNKEKGINIKYKNISLCKMLEISFADNAIKGIKKCLSLIRNNSKKGYQSCIKLIDIFFSLGGEDEELLESIYNIFNELNSEIFILILPLLTSRIGINNQKILEKLIKILVKLCLNFPSISLIPILINKYSNSVKKKSIAKKIIDLVEEEDPKLINIINNYDIFIKELNKCSLLLHEKWKKGIEDASKMLLKKDYNELINILEPIHKLMNEQPDNLYEIHFNQCFYHSLKTAENYLKKYIKRPKDSYIKFAWEQYQTVYNEIKVKYKTMSTISLKYISPLLSEIPENIIGLPGYYFLNKLNKERKQLIIGKIKENNTFENEDQPVYIKRIDKYLYVFDTKQKPRKISLIGSDDKEYKFLLKSNEDLRQDERIIQVFSFVNSMLSLDKEASSKKLLITIYPVIPLSNMTGLIGFLPNCETISHLITEQRKEENTVINIEILNLMNLYPKYNSGTLLSKVEAFKEANESTSGYELSKIIWTKSLNCESWLNRRTNYAQSLAVMSVVGYILGLGDRHPNNLMMNRQNGKIIHIDYGDCFEVAMFRKRFPEKIPFRLTRMFIKALGVSNVEGAFRIICEKIMKLLRSNKDSLYTILNSLVYDPLVTFKIMFPFLKNNRKGSDAYESNKNNNYNNDIKNVNNVGINEMNLFIHSSSVMNKISVEAISKLMAFSTRFNIYNGEENDNEKDEKINEEKNYLNFYKEDDEIENEDLNEVAQTVLNRIIDKLTGTDFNNSKPLEVEEQINRLIYQATNPENLCQLYLGWAPFW